MRVGPIIVAIAAALLFGCSSEDPTEPGEPAPRDREGILYEVAGLVTSGGYTGDGGSARQARLYFPQDVVVEGSDVYIVDWNNHVIRKVDAAGIISKAMGSGFHGDDSDGPVLEVNLNHPVNLAIGPTGDFYISGWHNWKIKKVDRVTGMVTSPVGTDNGFAGDGGPANQAQMSLPSSIAWDHDGNMYVSDQGNTRIRMIDGNDIITTFAGGEKGYVDGVGDAARFMWPTGTNSFPGGKLDVSADGEALFVADTEGNRIRKVDIATRMVTTIGGTGTAGYSGDDGAALEAQFNQPTDVACAPNGDIFIADSHNHVIRKIDVNGIVSTVAGTGVAGHSPDATAATSAQLKSPSGVYWDEPSRTLYISDTLNHQVKRVRLAA